MSQRISSCRRPLSPQVRRGGPRDQAALSKGETCGMTFGSGQVSGDQTCSCTHGHDLLHSSDSSQEPEPESLAIIVQQHGSTSSDRFHAKS